MIQHKTCLWGALLCLVLGAAMGCPATPPQREPALEQSSDAGQETQPQDSTTPDIATPDTTPDATPELPTPDKEPDASVESTPEPTPEVSPETRNEPTPPRKETWETATPLPDKRQETAVVALDGDIYIIGGIDANKTTVATVEAYNPTTKMWRKRADLPKPMHHANAITYKGKIYVLGFLAPSFGAEAGCFSYDPGSDKWTSLKDMPRGMQRGAAVLGVVGDLVYVMGGLRGFRSVTDLSVYDPKLDSWQALPPIPTDLDHLAGGAIGNVLVIAGGRHGNINSHIKATYTYDTATKKWTKRADMPTSRGGSAGAVYKGRLYIFGGEGNKGHPSGVFEEVESYELATDTWRKHPAMKTRRHGTNAATIGDKIYVPGGADGQAFAAVDTVEIFVPNH